MPLHSVAQLLKTEDDLDKIAHLREQINKEKSSIEIELKSRSQIEIEKLLTNFQNLQISSTELKKLRKFVLEINELADSSFNSIENYESINKLTKIHEIFEIVTFIVDKISNFEPELREIEELIEEENYEQIDSDSHVANLLPIHYKLNNILNFKDLVTELSNFSNDDSKFIIKKLVKKIDPIVSKFNTMLRNIIFGLIESCRTGNNSLVIRLIKIIDFEEQQDLKVQSQKKALMDSLSGSTDSNNAILLERLVSGNQTNSRIYERGYKEFFIKECEKAVRDMFHQCWDAFESKGSVPELFEILNNLEWVYHDLSEVQLNLAKLVPKSPRWDLFKIFYDIYYRELNIIVNRLIETEPETYFILEIIEFDSMFKEIMNKEFNLKTVKTVIGEVEKEKLLDDYLNLVITKNKGWMQNLMKTEQDTFKSRISAPELDSENLYGLEGSKIVFQMFTQQCDVSLGTKQGKILDGVITKFVDLLIERQNTWSKLIQSEVSKLIQQSIRERSKKKNKELTEDGDEVQYEPVPPGLFEYLIALGNDQMRGADYTEAISNKYGSMVSKKYQTSINENLEKSIDGFANLAKQCCDAISVLILNDLNSVFDKIFDKVWLNEKNENVVQIICDTIYEYLGEFRENMNQYLFEILVEEIVEECILRYLKNLHKETNIFKEKNKDKFLELVRNDFKNFYEMFIQFLDDKSSIESKFKIIEEFSDFLEVPNETLEDQDVMLTIWGTLVREYNDIPLRFFELMVRFKGINKSQSKVLCAKAETKQRNILQHEISANMIQQTYMGSF